MLHVTKVLKMVCTVSLYVLGCALDCRYKFGNMCIVQIIPALVCKTLWHSTRMQQFCVSSSVWLYWRTYISKNFQDNLSYGWNQQSWGLTPEAKLSFNLAGNLQFAHLHVSCQTLSWQSVRLRQYYTFSEGDGFMKVTSGEHSSMSSDCAVLLAYSGCQLKA